MTIISYVLQALQKDPATRSDDTVLAHRVYRDYAADNGISMEEAEQAARLLHKFPSYRTIARERAEIQAKHPELKNKEAAVERAIQEEICREKYGPDTTVHFSSFSSDSPDIPEVDFSDFDPDQLTL